MRIEVDTACEVQRFRFDGEYKIFRNARMESRHVKKHCDLDAATQNLLRTAIEKRGLSEWAYDQILEAKRTIANLSGEESISSAHIAEVIQYRSLNRKLWPGG